MKSFSKVTARWSLCLGLLVLGCLAGACWTQWRLAERFDGAALAQQRHLVANQAALEFSQLAAVWRELSGDLQAYGGEAALRERERRYRQALGSSLSQLRVGDASEPAKLAIDRVSEAMDRLTKAGAQPRPARRPGSDLSPSDLSALAIRSAETHGQTWLRVLNDAHAAQAQQAQDALADAVQQSAAVAFFGFFCLALAGAGAVYLVLGAGKKLDALTDLAVANVQERQVAQQLRAEIRECDLALAMASEAIAEFQQQADRLARVSGGAAPPVTPEAARLAAWTIRRAKAGLNR